MTNADHPPASTGRVAAPEIAELLQLRRRPAAVAAGAVVLLGLLLTLVLPDVVPANAVVGIVVGLLAVAAGVVLAVLIDGRDPILRGPRHLRRDGHTVLGRMAGPDVALYGGEVLDALERRIDAVDRLRVVLTGTGADPSELAVALGRGAAARGHTSLVIDLRAASAPGVAEVGAGVVRLGEAARLADDRPYAWISAGSDRMAGAEAAVGVAQRPPRDLRLLLIVAPDVATQVPDLLDACERTVVLVPADTEQRSMVTARMDALRRAGGRPEAVVVGGVALASTGGTELDTSLERGLDTEPDTGPGAHDGFHDEPATAPPAFEQRTPSVRPITPFAPSEPLARRTTEPAPDEPTPDEPTPDESTDSTSMSSAPAVEPVPAADTVGAPQDVDDTADAESEDDADTAAAARPAPLPLPPPVPGHGAAARTGSDPEDGPQPLTERPTSTDRGPSSERSASDDSPSDPPAPSGSAESPFAVPPRTRDDWDMRSIRPAVSSSSDVEVGGMAASDPLTTTAALEGLLGASGRSDEV